MDDPKPRTETVSSLLAVEDTAFLLRDEMRAIRFALEYAKAELLLRDWGIRSTVIVFGSSRIPSPEEAQRAAAAATGADQLRTALQQTRKAPRAPIVLFGEAYWRRVVSFEALAAEGMISPGDLKLIEYADTGRPGLGVARPAWARRQPQMSRDWGLDERQSGSRRHGDAGPFNGGSPWSRDRIPQAGYRQDTRKRMRRKHTRL
jgi:hypothetical protein